MGSTLKHLVELVGPEAAKSLCRAYGGVSHYIPQKPSPDHQFAEVVGMAAWIKICRHYGGGSLVLPKGEAHFKRENGFCTYSTPRALASGKLRLRQAAPSVL